MAKQLISILLSVFAAASLLVACQPAALDEIIDPNPQEPEVVPERTTIPYSLKVSTETTRVSYDDEQNAYQFKAGDILQVKGLGDRTDIEGELTQYQGNDKWSGTLSYSTTAGKPADDTPLEITLLHADNPHPETYAMALVGSNPQVADSLKYAVENYSLFSTQVMFKDSGGTLSQQAAFLDVTVNFIFDGTHEIEAGQALVDLVISQHKFMIRTNFVPINEKDFQIHFYAIVPGGITADEFTLEVGDRTIDFKTTHTLQSNLKYTVSREIVYIPQLGDPFWSDGTYGRLQHPDSDASIVGIIVYVNHDYDDRDSAAIDNAITEKDAGYGHGLVMALKNAAELVKWSDSTTILCCENTVSSPSETFSATTLSGYNNTNAITTKLSTASAASLAKAYVDVVPVITEKEVTLNGGTEIKKVTSGWFLPSIGQWMFAISTDGFGGANPADLWTNNAKPPKNWKRNGSLSDLIRVMSNGGEDNNLLVDSLNERLEKLSREFGCQYDPFGIPKTGSTSSVNYSDNYWSSSEYSASQAIRMNFGSVEEDYATIKVKPEDKTLTYFLGDSHYPAKVRPFLAF